MTIPRCSFTSVFAIQQMSHCIHRNYFSLHSLMLLLLCLIANNVSVAQTHICRFEDERRFLFVVWWIHAN